MNSNTSRVLAAVVAVVAIVVLFFVLSGDEETGDDVRPLTTTGTEATTPADTPEDKPADDGGDGPAEKPPADEPTIVFAGGEPEGGVAELTYEKGDQIKFVVKSDAADEFHVHGYEIVETAEAGGKVEFDFPADIEGIFEVESHNTGTLIAEITVNP